MPVKHTFVSAIPDDPAAQLAGEVLPQAHWNATHDLSTLVAADVTDFNSAAVAANATAVGLKADKTTTITGGTGLTGGGDLSANRIISLAAIADQRFFANISGSSAAPSAITAVQAKTLLAITESDVANLTTDLAAKLNLSGGTMTGALLLNADPSAALGAATKQYVDSIAQGLSPKNSVLVSTNANVTLLGNQTIDGISVPSGSRILVQAQTLPATNGIYLTGAGAWTRTTDADTWDEISGALVFIEEGTLFADTLFACTSDPGGTLGVTAINWTQIAGPGSYTAGTGLTLTGRQFSLNATTALVPDSTNRRYVTDAQLVVIGNTSGTNTGDQLLFKTISVAGQSDIVADTTADTLTIVAGANITLTTNAATDTLTITGTGGGSVPGSDKQVIFNDSGALGADAGLTYDESMQQITVGTAANGNGVIATGNGTVSALNGTALSVQPGLPFDDGSTPADGGNASFNGSSGVNGGGGTSYQFSGGNSDTGNGGNILFKSGNSGGTNGTGGIQFQLGTDANGTPGELSFINVATVDPQDAGAGVYNSNGVLTFSQMAGAWEATPLCHIVNWTIQSSTTAPQTIGAVGATNGTFAAVSVTTTNFTTRQARSTCSSAASAGAVASYSWTGNRIPVMNTAGLGGSHTELLQAITVNTTGHQAFFGVFATFGGLSGDPSSLTNCVGIGFDAADLSSGNWKCFNNDGSGTANKTDTGIPRAINSALLVRLHNEIGTLIWDVFCQDMNTGVNFSQQFTTDVPVSGSVMAPTQGQRTGALTSAVAPQIIGGTCKWNAS